MPTNHGLNYISSQQLIPDSSDRINTILQEIYEKYADVRQGAVADYIPQMAKANPNDFAIAIVTAVGEVFTAGKTKVEFTLQSLSKPFVYGLALADYGRDEMLEKVGVATSGMPFDSVIDPAIRRSPLLNPLGNAGAMAAASLIKGTSTHEKWKRVQKIMEQFAGRRLLLDKDLYRSEMVTNFRNRALANLFRSYSLFYDDIDDAVSRYTKACSLKVTTKQLAIMGATLANGGVNPINNAKAVSVQYIRDILSVMLTYGLYDGTGRWIFDVGLPAKSGVSGGLLAIVPHRLAIAAYSPLLNAEGNSVRAVHAIKDLAQRWCLHLLT